MKLKRNIKKKFKNKYINIFILGIFIALFSNIIYGYGNNITFFKNIGSFIDDSLIYSRIYENNIHNDKVVIVKIDDRTLDGLGQMGDLKTLTFSKSEHSKVIENLFTNYNISTLGIDIIYANNSTEKDENVLKDTFYKYRKNIVIASMGDTSVTPLCKYGNIQHGSVLINSQDKIRKIKIDFPEYKLENKCNKKDILKNNLNGINTFGVEIFKKYLKNDKNLLKVNQNIIKLNENLIQQSKMNNDFFLINFSHNSQNNLGTIGFKSYSLIDIYNNRKTDRITGDIIDLEGKIVLIGEVGTSFKDALFTPIDLNNRMPGVEIHANVINTMLYDSYLTFINNNYKILLSIIFVFLLMFLFIKIKNRFNVLVLLFYFFVQIIIGLEFFSNLYIYPVSFFIFLGIITFIITYIYKYKNTEKDKKFIKKAFSMYLSSHMVDKIIKNHNDLKLTGKKGNLTIFFSDIVGFTTISENMKSKELFSFINKYLSEMTKILMKNDGTLDKYIGDAVMGFFNAPIEIKNPEKKACITALEQIKKIKVLNEKGIKKGLPKINIRIGINTGEATHGNLGSEGERINYTVIGDSVNLAARLESINKYYGTEICIGEETYKIVKDDFIIREMDTIKVKGKNKGVKIYELIGKKGHVFDNSILINYNNGLKKYYKGNYKDAISSFKKNKFKKDKISEFMIERCKKAMSGEIIIKDGVYKMITK